MADQLAIAIENTRLLEEVQSSMMELQIAYGQYTNEAWLEWLHGGDRTRGYHFHNRKIEPVQADKLTPRLQTNGREIAVPLVLRGETFGEIRVKVEEETVPAELSNLIKLIAERLSVSLDSARLFEDAQRRATQEQITGEITSRIRESLDIDTVVRTAVQEIGERLGLYDLSIQLDLKSETHQER